MNRNLGGEIVGASIPDDDVIGWIQTLREGGLSDAEIDSFLSNLNLTYRGLKKEEFINNQLNRMDGGIFKRRGIGLNDDEKVRLRKGIESRFAE